MKLESRLGRLPAWTLGWCTALMAASPALADEINVTLVQPGGGYLAADGRSTVALELLLRDESGPIPMSNAKIAVRRGKVTGMRIMGPGRVGFSYQTPNDQAAVRESVSIELTRKNKNEDIINFSFDVAAPSTPSLELTVSPTELQAETPKPIDIEASAQGRRLERIELVASTGALTGPESPVAAKDKLHVVRSLELPPNLPADAPSHVMILGAVSNRDGFFATQQGVSVIAPIRISAEIPRGSKLYLEGTETSVSPVRAPADGRAVIEGRARYGARISAHWAKGRKKKDIAIVVPSGAVPVALAAPIPDQNVADGGLGPSLVVALPPPPFGGELFWPEIEIEGARLVSTVDLSDTVKALVLERPTRPGPVTLILEGVPLEPIHFRAATGRQLKMEEGFAKAGERGAVTLTVTDSFGNPTDVPRPRVRLESGHPLELDRESEGRYRVVATAGTPGDTGDEVVFVAEISPPRVLAGDPPELSQASREVELEGPAPAIKADFGGGATVQRPSISGMKLALGVSALATAGTTFGSQLLFGGGLAIELRLPVLDERLALRTGIEVYRGTGQGDFVFTDNAEGRLLDASTTLGGAIVPIELGFVVVQHGIFELALRAGAELRMEAAALQVAEDSAGGGSRTTVAGRATIDSGFVAGPGSFNLGLTLGGIGASADGFSSEEVTFEGSLMHLRLDLGYRIWL